MLCWYENVTVQVLCPLGYFKFAPITWKETYVYVVVIYFIGIDNLNVYTTLFDQICRLLNYLFMSCNTEIVSTDIALPN